MLRHLESITPGETTSLAQGVKNFCLRNPGKGIAVLISDLLDKQGYAEALKYLVSRQMDVYVVQVLSAEELDPPITGDLKLVDCEDHDVAEISAGPAVLKRYRANLAAFVDGARDFCARRGMNYLVAGNQGPVEQLISNYLRKRGLVR
jgi:hypothetical protein